VSTSGRAATKTAQYHADTHWSKKSFPRRAVYGYKTGHSERITVRQETP